MQRNERTSRPLATSAAKLLADPTTPSFMKSLAASALAQARSRDEMYARLKGKSQALANKVTSERIGRLASKILRDPQVPDFFRAIAGTDLTQRPADISRIKDKLRKRS